MAGGRTPPPGPGGTAKSGTAARWGGTPGAAGRRHIQAGLPGLQAVEQGAATGQLRRRQARASCSRSTSAIGRPLPARVITALAPACSAARLAISAPSLWPRGSAGRSAGRLELVAPGDHIGDIALDAEVALVGVAGWLAATPRLS
jgi:hypothetical protein